MSESSEQSEQVELTRGEFARRSGLSPKALRLYERSGLLVPHRVEAANGYRFYLPGQVGVAVRVRELRRMDMPLSMVAEVVAASPQEAVGLVRAWWRVRQEVERSRQAMLERVCDLVGEHSPQSVTGAVPGSGSPKVSGAGEGVGATWLETVPAVRVACARARVGLQDLVETYLGLAERVRRVVVGQGARVGEQTWVIYHGTPSPDGAALIEVAVPYEGVAWPERGVSLRWEGAGVWLVAAVARRDCFYPRIMGAYAAVERGLVERGLRSVDGFREVYVRPWESVGEGETFAWVVRPVVQG
ncbi:MerR family transcriptional regulator [Nocardiopsis metallicus]|uniref:DNA-binding transcriptional MerR regulator n=1 Tax=Nocardiopsis metallicus TaxID=179819 RepID=A0A840WBP7_9ACTN|nr:MerR family transcriptional regulator [Nocardiopsis metallicus]MBB5490451.1 DNA-binding transcriptional MerR regulator [Nocardiopsis metallicus]